MSDQNKTFVFLADFITAKVVERLVEDRGLDVKAALLLFHNSETFEKLWDSETALYVESPNYVYEVFKDEERRGTLRGLNCY